jgi:hypothetical protein
VELKDEAPDALCGELDLEEPMGMSQDWAMNEKLQISRLASEEDKISLEVFFLNSHVCDRHQNYVRVVPCCWFIASGMLCCSDFRIVTNVSKDPNAFWTSLTTCSPQGITSQKT